MDQSNQLGSTFEQEAYEVLQALMQKYPKRVHVEHHPRVLLQSEEEIVPDFEMLVILPHERQFYAIECQARKQYSKAIVHKFQYFRTRSWLQTYLFVYPASIPDELKRAFDMENVLHFPLAEFRAYIDNLGVVLEGLRSQEVAGADPAEVFAVYKVLRFKYPLSVALRDNSFSIDILSQKAPDSRNKALELFERMQQEESEREALKRAISGYGQKDRGMLSDG